VYSSCITAVAQVKIRRRISVGNRARNRDDGHLPWLCSNKRWTITRAVETHFVTTSNLCSASISPSSAQVSFPLRAHLRCYLALQNSFWSWFSCSYVSILVSHTYFTCLAFLKILSASLTLHPPHLNIRAGAFLFGDSGARNEYHALPIEVHGRPLVMPHATGSVIMSKLGNETAKCARFCFPRAENS
jgi:hypothetical protein